MIPWGLPAKCIQVYEQKASTEDIRKGYFVTWRRAGQIMYEISFRIWEKLETICDAKHWLSGEKCNQKSPIYSQMLTRCLTMGTRFETFFLSTSISHPTPCSNPARNFSPRFWELWHCKDFAALRGKSLVSIVHKGNLLSGCLFNRNDSKLALWVGLYQNIHFALRNIPDTLIWSIVTGVATSNSVLWPLNMSQETNSTKDTRK